MDCVLQYITWVMDFKSLSFYLILDQIEALPLSVLDCSAHRLWIFISSVLSDFPWWMKPHVPVFKPLKPDRHTLHQPTPYWNNGKWSGIKWPWCGNFPLDDKAQRGEEGPMSTHINRHRQDCLLYSTHNTGQDSCLAYSWATKTPNVTWHLKETEHNLCGSYDNTAITHYL